MAPLRRPHLDLRPTLYFVIGYIENMPTHSGYAVFLAVLQIICTWTDKAKNTLSGDEGLTWNNMSVFNVNIFDSMYYYRDTYPILFVLVLVICYTVLCLLCMFACALARLLIFRLVGFAFDCLLDCLFVCFIARLLCLVALLAGLLACWFTSTAFIQVPVLQ